MPTFLTSPLVSACDGGFWCEPPPALPVAPVPPVPPDPVGLRPLLVPLLTAPAFDDPEGARCHAVAAAVADVVLHDDGPELGAEERAGRAHVEAGGVGAVLADVGGHEPPHVRHGGVRRAGAGCRAGEQLPRRRQRRGRRAPATGEGGVVV